MRMVNISNEKSMQSYTARCSRYKNKYTNLVCGKTAVGRNYNLPRDSRPAGGACDGEKSCAVSGTFVNGIFLMIVFEKIMNGRR